MKHKICKCDDLLEVLNLILKDINVKDWITLGHIFCFLKDMALYLLASWPRGSWLRQAPSLVQLQKSNDNIGDISLTKLSKNTKVGLWFEALCGIPLDCKMPSRPDMSEYLDRVTIVTDIWPYSASF